MGPTEPVRGGVSRAVQRRGDIQAVLQPDLDVTVTLPTAQVSDSALASLERAIQGTLSHYTDTLGVPAHFLVKVEPPANSSAELQVLIAGRAARVVPEELSDALTARGLTNAALGSGDGDGFVEAVTTACRVAVEWDPALLVGPNQQEKMLANARATGIRHYPDVVVAHALKSIVAHGISIADMSRLKATLDQPTSLIETAGELSEVAIDALGPPSIGVIVGEATLRSATISGVRRDAFTEMRSRLFGELGVTLPDIEVAIDDSLPKGTAAARLNSVLFTARPLAADAGVADIAAVVERQLRNHAAWLVSLAEVRRVIEDIRLALPDLLDTVLERYSEPQLAQFARTFVEERVPVRNAARLLMLLLDAPEESTGRNLARLAEPRRRTSLVGEWPSPRHVVSFTRQEMNEEATRSKPGTTTVHATRLPTDLDTELTNLPETGGLDHEAAGAVLDQLIRLAEQQIARGIPILVTSTQRSRAIAKNLLARQYPEVAVLAAEEYPPSRRLAPLE